MMEEASESSTICTYSHMSTREPSLSRDLTDYWEDPTSHFMVSGESTAAVDNHILLRMYQN